MTVQLSSSELRQAVLTWCRDRGINVTDDTQIHIVGAESRPVHQPTAVVFGVDQPEVESPPKDGPYR